MIGADKRHKRNLRFSINGVLNILENCFLLCEEKRFCPESFHFTLNTISERCYAFFIHFHRNVQKPSTTGRHHQRICIILFFNGKPKIFGWLFNLDLEETKLIADRRCETHGIIDGDIRQTSPGGLVNYITTINFGVFRFRYSFRENDILTSYFILNSSAEELVKDLADRLICKSVINNPVSFKN